MNRNDIAKAIAEDLLNNDVLDENNFSYDTATILEYVQNIILQIPFIHSKKKPLSHALGNGISYTYTFILCAT